ncbi:hypothetical protein ACFS6H_20170 [Terrimonas rubra]|uniref:Internal virion protein n=1 Tax=Terrimonas rubra TaxID=1035890 RepID=A0ABW6A9M9_9BACT
MPIPIILGALALGSGAYKMIASGQQKKALQRATREAGYYTADDNVKQNLALAQNLYNGRMAGASRLEAQIYGNQANTIGAMNRNVTDSSQALALAGSVQGNTNEALQQLAISEAQDRLSRYGILANASQALAAEKYKERMDKIRYQNQLMGIKATHNQNIATGVGDMVNGLGMIASGAQGLNQNNQNLNFPSSWNRVGATPTATPIATQLNSNTGLLSGLASTIKPLS